MAIEKALSRVKSLQKSGQTLCGICSAESWSSGEPAALKILPRCVAGFHPLFQIQTVGARIALRRRRRVAGTGCWRLGCGGSLWLHMLPSLLPVVRGQRPSEPTFLLGGCWVSPGKLHVRLGWGLFSPLPLGKLWEGANDHQVCLFIFLNQREGGEP